MQNTQSLAQPTPGANPLTTACDLPPNQITNITVFADQYPQTRFPYWDVKAQSEMRYMNPKYEGYVKLTISSDGVKDRLGYNTLTQFDLKFFLIGHQTQAQFESSAKSLLSPLAREAWDRDFKQ